METQTPELWLTFTLVDTETLSHFLRLDRGTETGLMATMHSYLHQNQGYHKDPTDLIKYGPSTSNKIERWWRDLHERMEKEVKAANLVSFW